MTSSEIALDTDRVADRPRFSKLSTDALLHEGRCNFVRETDVDGPEQITIKGPVLNHESTRHLPGGKGRWDFGERTEIKREEGRKTKGKVGK